MNIQLQNLVKELLSLHKLLLDGQRAEYELKNGVVLNNNDYFNLVVNHSDFKWLRALSEVIAIIDEESEQGEDNKDKVSALLMNLEKMLRAEGSEDEFSLKFRSALAGSDILADRKELVLTKIKELLR
ncbi:MAG: hypothetical protein WC467_04400 [Patescibacteria group bacterium]